MARKNQRKQSKGHIVPVPFAMMMVLGSILALGYLWLEIRCDAVGKEIKVLEAEKVELRRKCADEEARWANMKAPGRIEAALRRHGLDMAYPTRDQVIRINSDDIAAVLAPPPVAALALNVDRARHGGVRGMVMND